MIDPIQILWTPAGVTMPALGARSLVDVTDGDTPNIRLPIRMLSVDTPEVTARSELRAAAIDEELRQLAEWIEQGKAPISRAYAEHLLPKLATGTAGTLQYRQGKDASAFAKQNTEARLRRPNGTMRTLFVRAAERPFDDNGRLLAYTAPNYSAKELSELPRDQRPTFNLDMVAAGWAVPFVIYPSIPGELDLPLLVSAAASARAAGLGTWADADSLPAYEYRAAEKLFSITRKLVEGVDLGATDRFGWRSRYCVDMRTRVLVGPEGFAGIPVEYRLWLWQVDVAEAVSRLNLTPAPALVGA